jgi:hypothetical protein
VKATRNLYNKARTEWGAMYPMQLVDAALAMKAGVDIPQNDWDRHHYEAMLPGFGGSDSMDWRAFVDTLNEKGFKGPYEIENEAKNSKATDNAAAIVQGYQAAISFLSPMLWSLTEKGYQFKKGDQLKHLNRSNISETTVDELI